MSPCSDEADGSNEAVIRAFEKSEKTRTAKIIKIFGLRQDIERFLDIGCNDGSLALLIKHACDAAEVYGLDQTDEFISLSKQKGIKTFKLDIDKNPYPFPNDYFDAVFAGEVLEHLNDPDHFFEEIHRILRKRGTLVLTTPNLAAWHNRIALMLGFQPFGLDNSWRHANAGKMYSYSHDKKLAAGYKRETKIAPANNRHQKLYTRRALKSILELYNFHILQCQGYPYPLLGKRYLAFNATELIMDRLGAGNGIIISCYKK
jgi:SAM-dependent methyltransferase